MRDSYKKKENALFSQQTLRPLVLTSHSLPYPQINQHPYPVSSLFLPLKLSTLSPCKTSLLPTPLTSICSPSSQTLCFLPLYLSSLLVPTPIAHKYNLFKKRFYLFISRERGREGERERNINVWLPLACPQLGTWPAAQACALIRNRTSHPLVHGLSLEPLSHTSQGQFIIYRHLRLATSSVKLFQTAFP